MHCKSMGPQARRVLGLLVFAAILLSSGSNAFADTESHRLSVRYPTGTTEADTKAEQSYASYLASLPKGELTAAPSAVDLPLDDAVASDGAPHIQHVSQTTVLNWEAESIQSLSWTVEVPADGLYNLMLTYAAVPGTVDAPRRSLTIDDGRVAFQEMSNIVFQRCCADAGKPDKDAEGNELRPRQVEIAARQTMRVEDALGRYDEPLKFYLTKGKHSLKLNYVQEALLLYAVRLVPPEDIPSYAEVSKVWQEKGYKPATASIKIDAENCKQKTDSSIRLEYSTDPLADPVTDGKTVYNSIGGSNWNQGEQAITWELKVPESGLYTLDFRFYQKYNDGLSSYRQIRIDGKVPYRELSAFEFPYSDWSTLRAQTDRGEPYLVYLEKGTHTLELRNKTSPYTQILLEMEETLSQYSDAVQNIIRITGISPDVNFDYLLFKKLPWLKSRLQLISASLQSQITQLTESLSYAPGPVNSLADIKYRIDKMIADPYYIPANLTYLIDEQTTLSSWIRGFNNLPLLLDYIMVSSPTQAVQNRKSSVLQKTWFAFRDFIQSFTRDYNAVSETKNGETTISVWISRGKEWGETLKQLAEEDFTKQTGIHLKMNMVPSGQLGTSGVMLLAVASGTSPDVILGVDSTVPAEYGMRGALVDLTQMPDYESVAKRFLDGVMVPYRFQNAVYALPETMDFSVMYYRTDLLSALGLKPPDTWDDLYNIVLPTLKRNGMDFWYEGGLNTFLFQQGGNFYTKDGLQSGLDSQEAIEAFRQFSNLYLVYDVPVQANFYTRFRAGQMPIGISSFNTYLQLTSAAQELDGKWQVSLIPGTRKADGTIDRSNSVGSMAAMIFKASDSVAQAWDFLKWYTSKETQVRYASDLIAYIGPEAKWCSANVEAFDALSWDSNLKAVIQEQRKWCRGVPSVVGGYITARQVENARVRTVIDKMNYRESLERTAKDIDRELTLKNEEFARRLRQTAS